MDWDARMPVRTSSYRNRTSAGVGADLHNVSAQGVSRATQLLGYPRTGVQRQDMSDIAADYPLTVPFQPCFKVWPVP
eukprot:365466-Chlamydomonas_euryale.AAC.16